MQEALAQLVADTSSDSLSDHDIEITANFLLDCLAIGIAGRHAKFRDELLNVALTWGAGEESRLYGDTRRVPAATAAYINAFQMHCLEFDCVHEPAVAHVMTAPVAAALAECERGAQQIRGRQLLTALAVGVEVASVLGLAATTSLKFFRPATTGVFGAAATVACLRGFNRDQVLEAFGYALAQTAGTMQAHEEGKPTLAIQLAAAARAGLVAADLAATGIPAPVNSIDGTFGYLNLFETETSVQGLCDSLGEKWRVHELSYKPYPSGRATHAGIDLILRLREQGLTADNVDQLTLKAPPLIHQLVIRPAMPGMNVNYARLCFPYVGAVALCKGSVSITDFDDDALRDPEVLAVAERIHAEVSPVTDPAAFGPQRASARLNDGSEMQAEIAFLPGSPEKPLNDDERLSKVHACCGPVAGPLIDAAQRLAQVDDVRSEIDQLTGAG